MKRFLTYGMLAALCACSNSGNGGSNVVRRDAAADAGGERSSRRDASAGAGAHDDAGVDAGVHGDASAIEHLQPDAGGSEERDAAALDAGAPLDGASSMLDATAPFDATADAMDAADANEAGTMDATLDTPATDGAAIDSGATDSAVDAGRVHGLPPRVPNTGCFVNGLRPRDIVPIATAPAFPALVAASPVALTRFGDQLVLVEPAGRVRVFAADGDGSAATTVLDLGSAARANGLRGAAFPPNGGALFVSYLPAADPLRIVVARFALGDAGSADANSEQPLLTLPLTDAARAGGALTFMFDGTLSIAFGDGGDAAAATDPLSLAGKVARLDVSGASGYSVPADNPFVNDANSLPEILALGLGAPTSCSSDRITGRLYCADSYDASHDHIVMVTPGATLNAIVSFTPVGCGVQLGFVSRDVQLPDIEGTLVFGDRCSSMLQALRYDGSLVRAQGEIVSLPAALAAFGEDRDGRIVAFDVNGAASALVRPATAKPDFPTTVSATGCFPDLVTRVPAAGLIPFEVRTPLWSDGSNKRRFIVLPGMDTIGFTMQGAWQFPVGTMFIKEFMLDDDADSATRDRILETRFLIKRTDSSWEGYSYMWDRTETDAFLLEGSEVESYPMQRGAVDASGASNHRHSFPDRSQCVLCHNSTAGRALGLQTGRMNTDHDYDGVVENQLQAMEHIGLFSAPLPALPDDLPRFVQPSDTHASLESRARSWLYANCSHCHQPGGPTTASIDLRYETPLAATQTCGLTPHLAIAEIPNAEIIAPADSANSELFYRLSRRGTNQMPPVATLITDPVGVQVVQHWIDDALTTCP